MIPMRAKTQSETTGGGFEQGQEHHRPKPIYQLRTVEYKRTRVPYRPGGRFCCCCGCCADFYWFRGSSSEGSEPSKRRRDWETSETESDSDEGEREDPIRDDRGRFRARTRTSSAQTIATTEDRATQTGPSACGRGESCCSCCGCCATFISLVRYIYIREFDFIVETTKDEPCLINAIRMI